MNFQHRRQTFVKALTSPALLFSGGLLSRNYPANTMPFRADSSFLYFFEKPEPNSAALFDPADGTVSLFLPERALDDAVWHGEVESFADAKKRHQVDAVYPMEQLETQLKALTKGRQLLSMAVADAATTRRARQVTGLDLVFDDAAKVASLELVDLLASMRLFKTDDELKHMALTAEVTREAHVQAMRHSKPGVTEQKLAGIVEGLFAQHGCVPAYGTILSVRGEVLHNHAHDNTLQTGDIVLLDGGAEGPAGYCSDVTRVWPVGGAFSAEGRAIYEVVLKSQLASIAAVKPGVRFRDLHLAAARVIAEGLVDIGLLKGNASALVESGAHALFFPHGLGHQIGLDVHDLESFGDRIHYPSGRTRSAQFGTKYLRMDMDLAAGMTFTIEPGVYLVPAIIKSASFRAQFKDQVNFELAERFLKMNNGRGFGGIRIEDDVLCTASGVRVLTESIPKRLSEVEALAGSA